jgi:ABC-type Fe3+-hydroxamate transport system substrate-binding protein
VIFIQGMHACVNDQARALGIPVRRMRMGTLEEIRGAARGIGECLGVPDAAEELVSRVDGELELVRARTRARTRARGPLRTFLHVAHGPASPRPPFLTAGSGTFLTEVLETAGGANVFSDSPRPYPEVSVESVIERAAEVVMVSVPGARLSAEAASRVRDAWRELLPERPGRSAARVVFLTADCAQVPGPRVGLLAVEMERLLWPDGTP